ncbi:peptidase, partial [Micromonospora sp. NPDC003776]
AAVLAGVGLAVDRFDAAHPVPTHLMYALDAGTGKARWLSREDDPQPWTDGYVDGVAGVADDFPGLGDAELRSGPAPAANLPAPKLDLLSDTRSGQQRILRLRLVPQRPVRLASLHVDSATAVVKAATVAGRDVPVKTLRAGWGFGIVFHAPPPEGIEVTLTLTSNVDQVRFRAMDASDGLDQLPGFRPRPSDVGVVGSHTSEMLAVAETYSF